ncbi:hypothetical protein CLIB1423_01S08746 [[Candida] railenensis]|uniref:Uncharacterized protein n=1 Tax=[Candida] railenensis TaxID=45579 RepID=A0A9P0QKS5_9ASCO|nr:hypothetical protein CLIB1423_01S08746 [[Candida] railenensis]
MELLEYSDNATFNLKSSSDSEEEYQIMSKYFNSHTSDNDSSYTNDTDYDYSKPPAVHHEGYSYGNNSFEVEQGHQQGGFDYSNVQYFQPPPPHHAHFAHQSPSYQTHSQQHHHLQHQTSAEDFARATAGKSNPYKETSEPSHSHDESKIARPNSNSSPLMYTSHHQQQQSPLHHTPMSLPSHTPIQHSMGQPPMQQGQQQQHQLSVQSTPTIQRSFQAPNAPIHQIGSITSQSTHSTPLQQQRAPPQGLPISPVLNLQEYPDMTTMVNSNSNMVVPMVDTAFVDHRICSVCSKRITRDMSRHMRTHQIIPRFQCSFPKSQCNHKSGRFNRPYDFKKHLLNRHFKFDNPEIKKIHNLSDKLNHPGLCPCGLRFISKDWLDEHILTNDVEKKCPCIDN